MSVKLRSIWLKHIQLSQVSKGIWDPLDVEAQFWDYFFPSSALNVTVLSKNYFEMINKLSFLFGLLQ